MRNFYVVLVATVLNGLVITGELSKFLFYLSGMCAGVMVGLTYSNSKLSASAEEPEQKSAGADAPASQRKEDSDQIEH